MNAIETTEATRIAELEEELLGTELTEAQEKQANALFNALTCSTTALFALEMWLRCDCEDEVAADMVGELVRKMAKHEAATM